MCGICGIIHFDGSPVQEVPIRTMMQLQKHRGPDDEGIFMEDNVGLGFVRLSILDLSPAGHQPMFSHDGRYVVVYNGEIFNYIELREELKKYGFRFTTGTDTEVLLAAWQHWGEDCLDHFNGMWALVIYDRQRRQLFGARDRYGIKPFYYYLTDHFFAFASEIPPLLSLLPGKPAPDYQSVFDYLVFNRTDQTERTFFQEIKKLQHGNCFSLSTTPKELVHGDSFFNKSVRRWYDLRSKVEAASGFQHPEEFRDLLSSAVGLRLRSDVPVGVCLSGGLDSSAILSLLWKDHHAYDINTFSAVYQKGQQGDESEFIDEFRGWVRNMHFTTPTAKTLWNDLHDFVRAHAEPIPSTSPYAQFKVMELARKHVVVTLDGQGADEELAGYHYFFGFYFKELLRKGRAGKLFQEMFAYWQQHRSGYGIKTLLYFLLPEPWKVSARVSEKGYLNEDFVKQYRDSNEITETLYSSKNLMEALLDHFEYKLEHLLKWEDRNSMWFSLEARVPFLDHRLVEKILATASDWIIRHGMTKYILREAMKDLMPEKIRLRHDKIGFGTPQNEWFREEFWINQLNVLINEKRFIQRGIIDQKKLMDIMRFHLNKGIDYSKELWKLFNMEVWFSNYID